MKIFKLNQSRDEYFNTQIIRSNIKFRYCKVSIKHILKWKNILEKKKILQDLGKERITGPIICLGTRNGREVDLFRVSFSSNFFYRKILEILEIRRNGWTSIFPFFEGFIRSDINNIRSKSTVGVEINPLGKRKDIHIGSFDELPGNWENTFSIIYSNSFDQSQDPYQTAKEWLRIARNNSILIIGFADAEPTESDPIGNININDLLKLFPGELLFYEKHGSNYHDLIIKLKK